MNNIDKEKYLKKINKDNNVKNNNFIKKISIQLLLSIIIFLVGSILIKSDNKYKDIIYKNVYDRNISFSTIKSMYNKYLGNIIPIDKFVANTETVFNEDITYSKKETYLDSVKFEVTSNYLVPSLNTGMVVFVGEKDNYGNTIIVEGIDGIDIWYSNLLTTSVKLYDYIEVGSLLGEVDGTTLYLLYSQNGKFLDYNVYFK